MTTYLRNNRNLLWKNVVLSLAYVVPKITEGEELITSIGVILMFALYFLGADIYMYFFFYFKNWKCRYLFIF